MRIVLYEEWAEPSLVREPSAARINEPSMARGEQRETGPPWRSHIYEKALAFAKTFSKEGVREGGAFPSP